MKHNLYTYRTQNISVTPLAGVRIETMYRVNPVHRKGSHLSQVCGLKQEFIPAGSDEAEVTPLAGVRIETQTVPFAVLDAKSHLSQVCGLKLLRFRAATAIAWSHLSQVCGLKLTHQPREKRVLLSHLSQVCGLKPRYRMDRKQRFGHTSRRCAD